MGLATHLVWQEKTVQFCLGVDFHRYGCRYFVGRDFMACLVEDLEVAEEKYFMLWRYKYGCNPLESVEGDEMFRANKAAMSMIKLGSIPYVFMKMQLT